MLSNLLHLHVATHSIALSLRTASSVYYQPTSLFGGTDATRDCILTKHLTSGRGARRGCTSRAYLPSGNVGPLSHASHVFGTRAPRTHTDSGGSRPDPKPERRAAKSYIPPRRIGHHSGSRLRSVRVTNRALFHAPWQRTHGRSPDSAYHDSGQSAEQDVQRNPAFAIG